MTALDKLFFIIDGKGKYYRINKEDQLVVTTSKEEADVFNYAEAKKRINSGKKARFYSLIPVGEETEEVQEEIMNIDNDKTKDINTVDECQSKENRELCYDLSKIDWTEYLNNFCYIASSIKDYHEDLNKALSDIDLKICDVMHYVELNDLSDEESIAAVALLKELREARRKIKDEMYMAENVQKGIGTSTNVAKAKESIKQIGKLDTRRYVPRKLTDLFKEHNLNLKRQAENQAEKNSELYKESEKIVMMNSVNKPEEEIYERKETIFDGRKNDWRSFAQSQVDFFENAQQYIYNLEEDLDDIDDEIEDTLKMIETANYNVAQGYKVFKQLQTLRNLRKEKLRELDCLDALTEKFDCEGIARALRESLDVIEDIMDNASENISVIGKVS